MNQNKEIVNIIDGAIGKRYDLEVMKNNKALSFIGFTKHDLADAHLQRYFNVTLVNINGLGTGQAHFITENGSYLLLPWCYIISMVPSAIKSVNKEK